MLQILLCPECRRQFFFDPYRDHLCPECGTPLIDRCRNPRCSKPIKTGWGDRCPYCTTLYLRPSEDNPGGPERTPHDHPRRRLSRMWPHF
jgi:hypothetical protein